MVRHSPQKSITQETGPLGQVVRSMDAEEIRKVVRDELEAARKKDIAPRVFYAFASFVGSITLASFLFTWWAVRQDLPENRADGAAAILLLASALGVFLLLLFYSRDYGKGAKKP